MNNNPFYIQPAGDYSEGLQGLAQNLSRVGKERRARKRVEELRSGALQAFQTGDPKAMMEFSIANPEMSAAMKNGIAFTNEQTEDNYFQSTMSLINDPSPRNVDRVTAARQQQLKNHGAGDTALTDGFREQMAKDPKGTIEELKQEMPLMFPHRYKAYREAVGTVGNKATPYTNLAKLKSDFANGMLTPDEYGQAADKIVNPKAKNMIDLTRDAIKGDEESKGILLTMAQADLKKVGSSARMATKGKLEGLYEVMDLDGTAENIYKGKETIDQVRNTFGVPIQEAVRKKVLNLAEADTGKREFNFVQPKAIRNSLEGSLKKQQKQYAVMVAFIETIHKQSGRLRGLAQDVQRTGLRALNVPWRELKTRFVGSGKEMALEMLTKEISAEINKLVQNSQDSVALLPESARKEFERIHDPNLSLKELGVVIDYTTQIANDRYHAFGNSIDLTTSELGNVRTLGLERNPSLSGNEMPWPSSNPGNPDDPEGLFGND